MSAPAPRRRTQAGFTLLEAIVAIVLMGIVAGMMAVFIRAPLQGYKDSKERAELTDLADLALRRMARDLRLALPNSIRTNAGGTTLELLQTKTGGRYLNAADDAGVGTPLSFDDSTQTRFSMVGPLPGERAAIVPGAAAVGTDLLVINNQGVAPVDAYQLNGTNRNIAYIKSISTNAADGASADMPLIELHDNPFGAQEVQMPSETSRFQVVSGPVTYHCTPLAGGGGKLYRQWNYAISGTQAFPPVDPSSQAPDSSGPQSNLLIDRVHDCSFIYQPNIGGRGGIVTLRLELRMPLDGDQAATIRLVHQVHVDNTP
jgi:MSHA biogenesis protein MshO